MTERRRPSGRRLRAVRAVLLDVDGVLTDASMYYGDDGTEFKRFNTRDGMGIALLQQAGIVVGLVTQERSPIVGRRARKLKIDHVYEGVSDKGAALDEICRDLGCPAQAIAYVGDDLNDREIMRRVGLAVAVADAAPEVKRIAHLVTRARGGHGAVREVCNLLARRRERS